MRRYNDGMIYTNDKCVACAHCVHVCPAVGANVTANDNGRITIDVSDKNCIHCGSCIKECGHDARKFKDNLDDMLLDLKRRNRMQILRVIRESGPISRVDVASALEITRAAVTIITNEMIDEFLAGDNTKLSEIKLDPVTTSDGRRMVNKNGTERKRNILPITSGSIKTRRDNMIPKTIF